MEVEHALYVAMEKKTKLEEKNQELTKVLDMKNTRIRELEILVLELKK